MIIGQLRRLSCPACNHSLDGTTIIGPGTREVVDHDISVCIYCTAIFEFLLRPEGGYSLRAIPVEEFIELPLCVRHDAKLAQSIVRRTIEDEKGKA